jgi:AraC-like DNA-binding protein
MKNSGLSIARIAHDVGFVEMITFEREFKKHTQMTPKDFTESLRTD